MSTFTVNINAKNLIPPVAGAGADQNIVVSSAALSGTATDSDGSIVSTIWTQVSGPNTAIFDNNAILTPTVSSLIDGTYVFRLTATDDDTLTHFDDVSITTVLTVPNVAPTAHAGPDANEAGPPVGAFTFTLDGSASTDSDGTVVKYTWMTISKPVGSGAASFSPNGDGTNSTTCTIPNDGTSDGAWTFQLEVEDDQGATDTDTVVITATTATLLFDQWYATGAPGGSSEDCLSGSTTDGGGGSYGVAIETYDSSEFFTPDVLNVSWVTGDFSTTEHYAFLSTTTGFIYTVTIDINSGGAFQINTFTCEITNVVDTSTDSDISTNSC